MSKKSILVILFLLLVSVGGFSLYSTFAYNEEKIKLENSNSDFNLIYSLKENNNKHISVSSNEEKYVDFELYNIYPSNVMYGLYYYLVSPNKMPSNVEIELSDESVDSVSDIIKPNEKKIISLKIRNDSNYNLDLIIGALIGFENGDITDLVSDGEVLIK